MLVMTLSIVGTAYAQDPGKGATSYSPVDIKEDFVSIMARMKAAKRAVEKKHMDLLNERYDLSDRPAFRKVINGWDRELLNFIKEFEVFAKS